MNKVAYIAPVSLFRPNLLEYVSGLIVSKTYNRISNRIYAIPHQVGEYILELEVKKSNGEHEYAVGVYTRGEERFFIKSWQGRVKNYSYYALVNECVVSDVLSKRIAESMPESFLRIPRVIGAYQENNLFSVVFEYVEGKSLETFEDEVKKNTLLDIVDDLERLSIKLKPEDMKRIPTHTLLYYCLLLPVYALILITKYPKKVASICGFTLRAYKELRPVSLRSVQLAHRDIVAENVIVRDSTVYLIDCETVILTYPHFDFAMLESEYALTIPSHIRVLPETLFSRIFISIQRLTLEDDLKYLQSLENMGGTRA